MQLSNEQLNELSRKSQEFWVSKKDVTIEQAIKLTAKSLGYVKEE